MSNLFKKTRQLYFASAIIYPIILYVAFLLYSTGCILWSVLGVLIGTMLLIALPFPIFFRRMTNKEANKSMIEVIASNIAFMLCLLWFYSLPAFMTLLHDLSNERVFFDWRLIVAGGIWSAIAAVSHCRKIRRLSDEEIFAYLNGAPHDSPPQNG